MTLYKFYSDNCKPCEAIAPIRNQLKEKFNDKFEIKEYNTTTDDIDNLIILYNIASVPAFIIVGEKDGIIAPHKYKGEKTYEGLKEWILSFL